MIKYCFINAEKLLKLTYDANKEQEDEEDYEGAYDLKIGYFDNNGQYYIYSFDDYVTFYDFLFILIDQNIDFDVLDENDNLVDEDEYLEDGDFEDDEY